MPEAMAHSHLGMATDGRFVYVVSGQVGSQCRGPTARNFVLDTLTRTWSQLLPLPSPRYLSYAGLATAPIYLCANSQILILKPVFASQLPFLLMHWLLCRYAPATQLWRGRLHVIGGSKEDRQQPALEHWSVSVRNGKALEAEWRDEIPIPRGGPHR
jgi:hypothetical protein